MQKMNAYCLARACKPAVVLLVLATLSLAGCGKGESTTEASSSSSAIEGVTDEQLDAAVDETRQRVKNALKAQGVGSETAKGGYAVGIEGDGESASMGVDLDVPAWLPARFPLPEDLSISMVTTDKQGSKVLRGTSASVQQAQLAELAGQWAGSHNWEVVRSTEQVVTLANSDGEVLDVRVDDRTQLELTLSRRDIAWERQQAAPERKGLGSANITMGGDTRTVSGECVIKGSNYRFEYSAQDGSANANVQIQEANTTPTGSASFMSTGQGQFAQFSINFPMGNDNEPVITASGDAFSVSGKYASMSGSGLSVVDGNITVNCEL
jgi:hypothetical protein